MATQSSILAWKIPRTEEPGGLKPMGSQRVARRNINNLSYENDTTLLAESEELKSPLMKVKEESEKVGLSQRSEN